MGDLKRRTSSTVFIVNMHLESIIELAVYQQEGYVSAAKGIPAPQYLGFTRPVGRLNKRVDG